MRVCNCGRAVRPQDRLPCRFCRAGYRAIVQPAGPRQCVCCGTDTDLVRDHIQPLAMGGSNTADNMQWLCRSCNSSKATGFECKLNHA